MVASFPCMFLIPYLGRKFLKNGEHLTLYKSQGTQQQCLTCIKYSRKIWLECQVGTMENVQAYGIKGRLIQIPALPFANWINTNSYLISPSLCFPI